MGKSSGGAKVRITEYRLGYHLGIGLQVDGLKGIYFGEKEAWTGNVTEESVISIQKPDLHGGLSNEGGAAGLAVFMPGGRDQTIPDVLANRWGATRETTPGCRGFSSIFFVGNPALRIDGQQSVPGVSEFLSFFTNGIVPKRLLPRFYALWKGVMSQTPVSGFLSIFFSSQPPGFYVGANNPYLKTTWVKVWRAPKGLNPSTAMIGDDANVGHIIFEALTSRSWGMGASTGIINVASFEEAATTFFNEGFGVSFQWRRQTTVEALVSEMLDHVQAAIFVNPNTGLIELMPFRDDYVVANLRQINPSNAVLTNFQRKTWGETVNELIVSYTNPENEEEKSITVHDNGNIAMQGEVVSDSRNYYGIRNGDLAAMVAERDIAAAAAPLVSCEAQLNRTLWDVKPGEVLVLSWPEYDIEQIVVRVTTVDYGQPDSSKIKVSLLEDVFAATAAEYSTPPDTEHEDQSEDPRPIDFVRIEAPPAYMLNAANGTAITAVGYPEVVTMVLAAQDSRDTANFDLFAYQPNNVGELTWQNVGRRNLVSRAALNANLTPQVQSLLTGFDDLVGSTPGIGSYLMIGNDDDPATEAELCIVSDITDSGWVINRGILDTVPRTWTAGTAIWLVRPDVTIIDVTPRSDGEEVNYRILTRTSRGALALDDAPTETATLNGRPHYPLRPANVQVNGDGFTPVDVTGDGTITVTWSNRNRLTETGAILLWNDGSVTPEDGQTTTIEVRTTGGTLLDTFAGLTGSSFDIPLSTFGVNDEAVVTIWSVRDGLTSLQSYPLTITGLPGLSRLELSGTETGFLELSGDAQSGTDKLRI